MLIPYRGIKEKYNIDPKGVLHIGCHYAEEAKDYYNNGITHSIWVEADPGLISKALSVLEPYPNYLLFNDCLTDTDNDEVTFHIANNEGQSSSILELSLHLIKHPEVWYNNHITVKTKRLDSLFRDNNLDIEDYPFVNIDVQGAEGLVLKGFGELLHKVNFLYVECNEADLYRGCMQLPEMKEFLRTFGFVMKEKVMCGSTEWGDTFFIRENYDI